MNEKQLVKVKNSDVHSMHFRKLNNAGENFLTESGVYKLVFKNRKPNADHADEEDKQFMMYNIADSQNGNVVGKLTFINESGVFNVDESIKQGFIDDSKNNKGMGKISRLFKTTKMVL